MATVNMTDLDWLTAYSVVVTAGFYSLNPEYCPTENDLDISVTFDASEVFSDFEISVPFTLPPNTQIAINGLASSEHLSITALELGVDGNQPMLTISGSNLTASPLTVNFGITIWCSAYPFSHISSS